MVLRGKGVQWKRFLRVAKWVAKLLSPQQQFVCSPCKQTTWRNVWLPCSSSLSLTNNVPTLVKHCCGSSVPPTSSHSCLLTMFNETKLRHCYRCTVMTRLIASMARGAEHLWVYPLSLCMLVSLYSSLYACILVLGLHAVSVPGLLFTLALNFCGIGVKIAQVSSAAEWNTVWSTWAQRELS